MRHDDPRRRLGAGAALLLAVLAAGCASAPAGAYFPPPAHPSTTRVAHILHRAATAAGDDPARYSFAYVQSAAPMAMSDEEATIYLSDGLLRLPVPVLEAVIAHEVAHEVLGHIGTRRALTLSITAGFTVLGVFAPGAGLLDVLVNPVAVRAFSRRQELEADRKAVEILRAMGHRTPRRVLATALRVMAETGPRPKEDLSGIFATHPGLEERLLALEPLEPVPVAERRP